ncbi:MAG: o-succinylbenzoate synthase, partial [Bacteroidia bacterium]|nr:o-succinylbenzoate synthase [Bacteroidia bacterium]
FFKKTFHFRFDARTSRGTIKERHSWFIKVWDESNAACFGIGECGPLPGLSAEINTEEEVQKVVDKINGGQLQLPVASDLKMLSQFFDKNFLFIEENSALIFALETALLDLINGGIRTIFKNEFIKGQPIPINGLIWMGGLDFMLQQIEIKIQDGFRCIKLKVGGLDFEKECDILQYIRRKYFRMDIVIRLDANGAFKQDNVLYKLKELSKFTIHSIEQPIKTNSDYLPELCRTSPIPVALDEELIGVSTRVQKEQLLDRCKPPYIILKPTLHGGLHACAEWIEIAESRKIGWWLTSALESNVGLNAIAQFASNYPITIPQGLGTGTLYDDNFEAPLRVDKGILVNYPRQEWQIAE